MGLPESQGNKILDILGVEVVGQHGRSLLEIQVHDRVGWLCEHRQRQNVFAFWQPNCRNRLEIVSSIVQFLLLKACARTDDVWTCFFILFEGFDF